jgi:hypothetical protein
MVVAVSHHAHHLMVDACSRPTIYVWLLQQGYFGAMHTLARLTAELGKHVIGCQVVPFASALTAHQVTQSFF